MKKNYNVCRHMPLKRTNAQSKGKMLEGALVVGASAKQILLIQLSYINVLSQRQVRSCALRAVLLRASGGVGR